MKILTPAALLFCLISASWSAQAQQWEWTRTSRQTGTSFTIVDAWYAATDYHSNLIAGGVYEAPTGVYFGPVHLPQFAPIAAASSFIVKYDSLGYVHWAKGGSITPCSIACDKYDNVYFTGFFQNNPVTFDGQTYNPLDPDYNLLLVKFDSAGNRLWYIVNEAGANTQCTAVADSAGNVFLVGSFIQHAAGFGSYTVYNTDPSALTEDIFVAKFNSAGSILWLRSAGTRGNDIVNSITVDKTGNLFVAGADSAFTSTGFPLPYVRPWYGFASGNITLRKYSPSGVLLWTRHALCHSNDDVVNSVVADQEGSVYITGLYDSATVSFDTFTLHNSGLLSFYITKYDSSGAVRWVRSGDGSSFGGYCLTVDDSDKIWMVGGFGKHITFDTTHHLDYDSTGGCALPAFILAYNSAGGIIFSAPLNGGSGEDNVGIAARRNNIYIVGDYDCIPFVVGTDTITDSSPYTENFFASRLSYPSRVQVPPDFLIGEISIFPNPANTSLTFNSPIKLTQITITSLLGQAVCTHECNSEKVQIDIANLPAGMYLVRINGTEVRRFVKE